MKSLPAHAVRSLIIARKKLVGQRVTLENQIRGRAVVFGVRLPRALSPAFIDQTLRSSDGLDGLSAAMGGLIGARAAVLAARRRHQEDGPDVGCMPPIDDDPRRRPRKRGLEPTFLFAL